MATIVNEVITNFRSNMDKSTQAVAKAIKDTAKVSGQFSTSKSFSLPSGLEDRWNVMAKAAQSAHVPLMNVEKSFNKINMTVLKNGQIMDLSTGKIIRQTTAINKLTKANRKFDFSNLSLLFGFMAIQRATRSMIRSMVTTYQKANEDTQGLGKSTWELQAAWEFLKYSIVDALTQSPIFQELIQFVLNLVKSFNELSPKTKDLIGLAVGFLLIAATIGMATVQFKMFAGGILAQIPVLIGSGGIAGIATAFLWVAAIIAIVVVLWMTNLGNFRDFVKDNLGILWNWFKDAFTNIKDFVVNIFGALIDILKGDWDGAFTHLKKALAAALRFIISSILSASAISVNALIFAFNLIVDLVFNVVAKGIVYAIKSSIQTAVNLINGLIRLYNNTIGKITGKKIATINFDYSGFDKANAAIDKMRNSLKIKYITPEEVSAAVGATNKLLGIENEATKGIPKEKTPTKTVIDNSIKNINLDFKIPEGMDINALKEQIMNQLTEELNKKIDSVNN